MFSFLLTSFFSTNGGMMLLDTEKGKGKGANSTAVGKGKLVLERATPQRTGAGCFWLSSMQESLSEHL